MLTIMPESEGSLVGVRATGLLHEEDYRAILPRLEALFREHGRLRILFHADEGFRGWDAAAAWDDLDFGLSHRSDFDRLALVGAPSWVELCAKVSAFLFKGEVRVFPAEAMDDAWAWLRS
jgi:hypothetical protein